MRFTMWCNNVASVSPGRTRYVPVPNMPSRSFDPTGEYTECTNPLAATLAKEELWWPGNWSTCLATSLRARPRSMSTT
jgi:hypothetical protein